MNLQQQIEKQRQKVEVARRLWHHSAPSVENLRHAKFLAEVEELDRLKAEYKGMRKQVSAG